MPERVHGCDCHPFDVWLDGLEKRWADEVGVERYRRATARRSKDRGGKSEEESHRFGARAELAFARLQRVEWPARVDTFEALPDIDPDIEVRGSHGGLDLKLRESDMQGVKGERRFVVVIHLSILDTWRWVGWLRGREALSLGLTPEKRRRDLAPALWVPYIHLRRPETWES